MRYSQLFGKTLRQEPAEAETPSHRLLLKAGFIAQVAAGVYSYLPLAWRALKKIEAIIREEMDAAGGQELLMPTLQPLELWQESGRAEAFGQNLFVLKDRRDRSLVIAPTHEEVVTNLVKATVQSYRDLPLLLYQIQTKFRDEARPRGGLIRVREFAMKDAYSFDADEEGLERSYQRLVHAYSNIFTRCGLPAIAVEADSGAIGGKDSHEFILPSESGEDIVLRCSQCGYSANAERAEFRKPTLKREPSLPLEEVATPGATTIQEVSNYLGVPKGKTLKAVFYSADGGVVFVTIRGDLEVNEVKLKNLLKAHNLTLAAEEEVRRAGLVAGYASPIDLKGVKSVADDSVYMGSNFVVGANKPGYHLRNANVPRDFQPDIVANIALAQGGQGCPRCEGVLKEVRGIEVGHVFKLGTFFSQKLGATYLDKDGQQKPAIMGCYGIGVGRLLAAAIEHNHDAKGILFPVSIAPYHAYLCPLNADDPQVAQAVEEAYVRLGKAGIEVLMDDRPESAGVKFNDADLLGLPLRVVVSPRTLKSRSAEVKRRDQDKAALVPLEDLPTSAKVQLGLQV